MRHVQWRCTGEFWEGWSILFLYNLSLPTVVYRRRNRLFQLHHLEMGVKIVLCCVCDVFKEHSFSTLVIWLGDRRASGPVTKLTPEIRKRICGRPMRNTNNLTWSTLQKKIGQLNKSQKFSVYQIIMPKLVALHTSCGVNIVYKQKR